VKNTGTKYVRIMKQTAFWKGRNESIYHVWPFAAGIIFFLILAHPVYKMRIIQEPNILELWNKLQFEERKNNEDFIPCLKYLVPIFVE